MSLATIIRLEFTYPGVGILAGDSIQYLSLASAHGVIMVFFMIMPAIFGAFGNFLLPTQLGVHDVAFPRLNSAAFWFLPGGLIMLCQLVCVDRRYQRMNSFNIRELQSILQRRFFSDLINTNEHRDFLDNVTIGARFKLNVNNFIQPDQLVLYNWGPINTSKPKNQHLIPYDYPTTSTYPNFDNILNNLTWVQVLSYKSQPLLNNFITSKVYGVYKLGSTGNLTLHSSPKYIFFLIKDFFQIFRFSYPSIILGRGHEF